MVFVKLVEKTNEMAMDMIMPDLESKCAPIMKKLMCQVDSELMDGRSGLISHHVEIHQS